MESSAKPNAVPEALSLLSSERPRNVGWFSAGALLATWLQRYVIILGTAFGGAWTIVVGILAMMGDKTAMTAAAAGDIWGEF